MAEYFDAVSLPAPAGWGLCPVRAQHVMLLAEHEDAVIGVWMAAYGGRQVVVSAGMDGLVRVLDPADGAVLHAWEHPGAPCWGLSAGAEPLLIGSTSSTVLGYRLDGMRRWSQEVMNAACPWPPKIVRNGVWCGAEAFTREERDGFVTRRLGNGERLGVVPAAKGVLVGHDGGLFAVLGGEAVARLVDLVTGEPLEEFSWRDGLVPVTLAGPRDRWLLARTPARQDRSERAEGWVWDRLKREWARAAEGFGSASSVFAGVATIAGAPCAVTGTGGEFHPLRLWRLPGLDLVGELDHTDLSVDSRCAGPLWARCAAGHLGSGDVLVAGGADGRVVRVDLAADSAATAPSDRDPRACWDIHHCGPRYWDGAVGVLAAVAPLPIWQINWGEESIESCYLDAEHDGRPPFAAIRTKYPSNNPRVVTGVINGEPVAAVNCSHGFMRWSPSSGWLQFPASENAADVIIGMCGHGRGVLVARYVTARRYVHLEDGTPCRDEMRSGVGDRLALAGNRPVAVGISGHVLRYTYECQDEDNPEYVLGGHDGGEELPGEFRLENDCPSGCWCGRGHGWSIVHADAHGRVLIAQHGGTLHRYDMAAGTHLGAPVPAARGCFHGARTGRLHGRDLVLVMAGTGITVHDADTGVRLLRIATHTRRTYDVATAGEDSVVCITEHGVFCHRIDQSMRAVTAHTLTTRPHPEFPSTDA